MKISKLAFVLIALVCTQSFAQSTINTDKNQVVLSGKSITAKSIDNTKSIVISHDGTNGVIDVSSGDVSFPDSLSVVNATASGTVSGATGSYANLSVSSAASVVSVTVSGTSNLNGPIVSNSATGLGWHILNGANQVCTTTCVGGGCVFGQDSGTNAIVNCSTATADICLCAR